MNPLIKEYYDKVKHLYPQLSQEEFALTIHECFKYFRKRMGEDDLPDIRLKGFGSFQIFATPILTALKRNKKEVAIRIKYDRLRENDYYLRQLNMLEDYVKKNEKLFKEALERRNTTK